MLCGHFSDPVSGSNLPFLRNSVYVYVSQSFVIFAFSKACPPFPSPFYYYSADKICVLCFFAHLSKYSHTCPFLFFFVSVDQTFFGFVREVIPRRPLRTGFFAKKSKKCGGTYSPLLLQKCFQEFLIPKQITHWEISPLGKE